MQGVGGIRACGGAQRLKIVKGGHFDAYMGALKEPSSAARGWFVEHPQST